MRVAATALAAVALAGCGGGSTQHSEQQVASALSLTPTSTGYRSPEGCHVLVVLNTRQEVELYDGDEWTVANPAGDAAVKVSDGAISQCPRLRAALDKLP